MDDKESLWESLGKNYRDKMDKLVEFVSHKIEGRDIKILKNKEIDKNMMKKALAGLMIFSMLAMGFTGYKVNEIRTRAYDLYINEDRIATIRDEDLLEEVIGELEDELSDQYGLDIVIGEKIELEAGHAREKFLTDKSQLKSNIKDRVDFLVAGRAIHIDDKEVGVLSCQEDAEKLIEKVKDHHLDKLGEDSKLEEVKILEDVKYEKKEVSLSELSSEEDLIDHILNGGEEIKTHTIEVGENFWTLAEFYNTTMEELEEANPDKDPLKLMPGDEIKLIRPKSLITVETVEEVVYTEAVDYEIKVEKNPNMYTNQQKVKVEGQRGEKELVAKERKHNGQLVDKEVIKEELIKKPVDRQLVQGTKKVPRTVATGSFLMPTRGRISSPYGRRWGRMHRGLDIAASSGTAIKAADGGSVVFAGYKGSYGYMVEINHGNGYRTRYAHCSKLNVRAGQKVYKGQHIANVGNTGRSTGPHLHFEVLKNGVNQNPSRFVR